MLSVLNLARLSLVMSVAAVSIPRMGAVGAAAAVLVAQIIPLTAQGMLLWRLIAKRTANGSGLRAYSTDPGHAKPCTVRSETPVTLSRET